MFTQSVCCVCLDGNVAMYCINDTELRGIYETLAHIQLDTHDEKPEILCYICYSELKRYCRFAKLCKQSRQLLRTLANNSYELTNQNVDMLHYANGMKKKYSINVLEPTVLPPPSTQALHEVPIKKEIIEDETSFEHSEIDSLEEIDQQTSHQVDMETNDFYLNKPHQYLCSKINTMETDFDEHTREIESNIDENEIYNEDLSQVEHVQVDENSMFREKELCIEGKEIHAKGKLRVNQIDKKGNTQNQPRKKNHYVCSDCTETFTNKKKFVIHLRTHTIKTEKRSIDLYCGKCLKTFTKRASFTQHMRLHLTGRVHVCNICEKAFYVKVNLVRHMKIHTGDKQYACTKCDKKFIQKVHLKSHFKVHSQNKLYTKKRNSDNKKLMDKIKIFNQIILRRGEKPYVCHTCDKGYFQKGNLANHIMYNHIKEKDTTHICHICGKIFNKRKLLTIHTKIHAPSHFCPECNKACATSSSLSVHRKAKHNKEKLYACEFCNKKFSLKCTLTVHLRCHTGEKPFTCKDCGKKFSQNICLIKHSRIHTGIKPYACDQCGKSFTQKNSLTNHLKSHKVKIERLKKRKLSSIKM